jgi:hypothetical protein
VVDILGYIGVDGGWRDESKDPAPRLGVFQTMVNRVGQSLLNRIGYAKHQSTVSLRLFRKEAHAAVTEVRSNLGVEMWLRRRMQGLK